jgi:hypothetical protein
MVAIENMNFEMEKGVVVVNSLNNQQMTFLDTTYQLFTHSLSKNEFNLVPIITHGFIQLFNVAFF